MGNTCISNELESMFPNSYINPPTNSNHHPSVHYAHLSSFTPKLVMQKILLSELSNKPLKQAFEAGISLPTYQFRNTNTYYHGQWMDGKPHGNGKLYLSNGMYFQGGFKEGNIECEDGILICGDGSYYRGNFINNNISGYGKFIYGLNGFKYQGNWEDGQPNGYGIQVFPDRSYYEGEFKNGLKHGRGNFYWENGKKYIGQFSNGYIHGKGLLTKGKGIYQGIFNKNQKETKGKLRTEFGEYNGTFMEGGMSGEGKFQWNDGKVYFGEFKQNTMHGKGFIVFPNGQKVQGIWENGENKVVQQINKKAK